MTNQLRHNANLVDSLGAALRSGDHAFAAVPGLLKQVLQNESWREFTTTRGELVTHKRFESFVVTPPLAGLGADLALIRRIVGDDPETRDLLDRAEQRPAHAHADVDNVNVRPTGNTSSSALRRLRKDRPDLHQRVLAKELSPNAAMVLAGLRPKTVTVRATIEGFAKAAISHLTQEERHELALLLRCEGTT